MIALSKSREGKIHDKRLLDEEGMAGGIPDEIVIAVDLGFQGLQNEYVNIQMPHKEATQNSLRNLSFIAFIE